MTTQLTGLQLVILGNEDPLAIEPPVLNDPIYEFFDASSVNGNFVLNGVVQPKATDITITASQLSSLVFTNIDAGDDYLDVYSFPSETYY
jgi:hypothetical protein